MLRRLLILVAMVLFFVSTALTEENKISVTIETLQGAFVLEIYPDVAPKLAARFIELSEKEYYVGTLFHYLDAGFIIAGGDLHTRSEIIAAEIIDQYGKLNDEISATALGLHRLLVRNSYLGHHLEQDNPARRWSMKEFLEHQGYSFDDSLPSIPIEYGSIAMASNEPNSNYTQFIIITSQKGTPWLSGKNTVIGKVVSGMDVVHKIEQLPHDDYNFPLETEQAEIISITVE